MENQNNSELRQEALNHKNSPDSFGEIPVYHRQSFAKALWILGICVILISIWALYGRINENVYGGGVITRYAQYGSVSSPGNGILVSINIQEGDMVQMGQLLGRIFSREDFESLLTANRVLEYEQETYEIVRKRLEEIKRVQKQFSKEELERLDAALERIKERLTWHDDFVNNKAVHLAETGAMAQTRLMELREAHDKRLREQEALFAERLTMQISAAKNIFELENKLLEYELAVRKSRFDAEQKMREILYRSRVVSYCDGRVSNINVRNGDLVTRGMELIRVADMHDSETTSWVAYCYIPVSDAKKIRPGMSAAVTPSTVKAERDGAIYGVVAEVSQDLETKESLMAFYRNSSFSDFIFNKCKMVPIKIKVALSCNKDNASGFNWTSGKGPDIQIAPGTLCNVRVTVRHASPIELILGNARKAVLGVGVMEERKGFDASAEKGF